MSEKLRKIKDKASKAFSENKLKDALKLYTQAVEEDPSELACRIKIGDIHRRLGDRAQAVSAYEPVAIHYAEDGMLLKAIAVCKLILSVDAAHTATQEMLANLYSKRGAPSQKAAAARAESGGHAPARMPASRAVEIEIDESEAEPMVVERSAAGVVSVGADGAVHGGAVDAAAAAAFAWPTGQVIVGSKTDEATSPPGVPVIMGAKVEGPARPKKRDVKEAAEAAADAAAEAVARALAESSMPSPPAAEARGASPEVGSGPGRMYGGAQDVRREPAPSPPIASAWPVAGSSAPSAKAQDAIAVDLAEDEPLDDAAAGVVVAEEQTGSLEEIFDRLGEDTPAGGLAPQSVEAMTEAADEESHPIELSRVARPKGAPTDDIGRPQIPLFSDLPRDAFIEILVQMTMREMGPGEYVITEGEVGNSFFVLAQGKVRIARKADDGSETILAYLTDGAFFGEMALLQDGARTASVIVEEDSQIFELSKPVLDAVVAQYPTVAKVLKNFYTQRLLSTTMATHPLFKSFGAKERRELMEMFKSRPFKAGDVLVEEGKKGEGLYLLLNGTLEVSKMKDGAQIVIAELLAGDVFGEISLLTNRPTVATVKALSDCFVLRLSKKNFDEVIMSYPQILEMVSQISEERQTENNAIFGAWSPNEHAALV